MSEEPEPTLSWQEREIFSALRRLASARSQLDALEQQLAEAEPLDQDDVDRAMALHEEMAPLRRKAEQRFGGSSARERLAELELQQRLVLERLGVADVDELQALVAKKAKGRPEVDPTVLDFARRELAAAEQAFEEIRSMEIPEAVDEPDELADDEDDDGEGAEILRLHPPAAS